MTPPSIVRLTLCAMTMACSALAGCQQSPAVATAPRPAPVTPYQPTATFQEIMDGMVDRASDFIWNSVSVVSDEKGMHEKHPVTSADWNEIRRRALLLAESANLIAVPGRRVATGSATIETADPLQVPQIQQRLDTRRPELVSFAQALRETASQLVQAAERKDTAAIVELGGALDEVCESCHVVFWYPEEVAAAKR